MFRFFQENCALIVTIAALAGLSQVAVDHAAPVSCRPQLVAELAPAMPTLDLPPAFTTEAVAALALDDPAPLPTALPVGQSATNCSGGVVPTNCNGTTQPTQCAGGVTTPSQCPNNTMQPTVCPAAVTSTACPDGVIISTSCPGGVQTPTNCPGGVQLSTICGVHGRLPTNCPGGVFAPTNCPTDAVGGAAGATSTSACTHPLQPVGGS